MLSETNRVTEAIARMEKRINDKLNHGETTQLELDRLYGSLDLSIDEYVRFQELKSIASMDGTLTPDEAQTIYMHLGETPYQFNDKQSLAVKCVLTQIFKELLEKSLVRAR